MDFDLAQIKWAVIGHYAIPDYIVNEHEVHYIFISEEFHYTDSHNTIYLISQINSCGYRFTINKTVEKV
jgi:hypothetical protein